MLPNFSYEQILCMSEGGYANELEATAVFSNGR
jgi:hypothetical protein